ncbi:hypothetical protein CF326_g8909 [Tilletia indica]|nr:hypothetical protein CF326_g8909 [Tilletia indica]
MGAPNRPEQWGEEASVSAGAKQRNEKALPAQVFARTSPCWADFKSHKNVAAVNLNHHPASDISTLIPPATSSHPPPLLPLSDSRAMPTTSGNSRIDYIDVPPATMRLEISDGEGDGDTEEVHSRAEEANEERTVSQEAGPAAARSKGHDDSQDAQPSSSRASSKARSRNSRSTPRKKAAPRRAPAKEKSGGAQARYETRSRRAPSDSSVVLKAAGDEAADALAVVANAYPQATAGWRLSPGSVEQLNASVVGHTVRSALEDNPIPIAGDPALNREFVIRATVAACVAACLDRVE